MKRIASTLDPSARIEVVPNRPGILGRIRTTRQLHSVAGSERGPIHFFGGTTIALGSLALLGTGARPVAWVRNSLQDTGGGSKLRLLRWALHRASAVSANSYAITQEIRLLGIRDVATVNNWIPAGALRDEPRAGPPRDAPLLWCGRLAPAKRPHEVVRAYARANVARPLVIVGDGPFAPSLRSLVEDLAVADRVRFAGHSDSTQAWYRRAAAFLFASDFDASANSLLEALGEALPVVAFAGQGADEVLGEGAYGLYHDRSDEEGFAASLQALEDEDTYQYWSRAALSRAQDYSWPKVERAYVDFIARAEPPDDASGRN